MDQFWVSFPILTETLKVKLDIILYSKGIIIIFCEKFKRICTSKSEIQIVCFAQEQQTALLPAYNENYRISYFFQIHLSERIRTGVYIIWKYKQPSNTTNMISLIKYLLFTQVISEDWKLACRIHTQGRTAVNHSELADVVVLSPKIA